MCLTGNGMKSIQRIKAQKMKKYDLSSAHTGCICRLAEAGEAGMTQMELVRMEMIDPSQISRVLRELIAKGYAIQDGEEGRYRRRYILTEAGMEIGREIKAIIEEIYNFVCRGISQDEISSFHETYRVICNSLNDAEQVYLDKQ